MVLQRINHDHHIRKLSVDNAVPVVSVMLRPHDVDLVVTKMTNLAKQYAIMHFSVTLYRKYWASLLLSLFFETPTQWGGVLLTRVEKPSLSHLSNPNKHNEPVIFEEKVRNGRQARENK